MLPLDYSKEEPLRKMTSVPSYNNETSSTKATANSIRRTYLERYLPTLEPNDIRTIQQILSTSAYANRKHCGPLSHPSGKKGLVKHFKTAMKANRETQAIEYLRARTLTTWSAAPSFHWMQALTNLHPRLCGAIPRYAVLCWTVGGESDCWFWRHFHKLGPCICGRGRLADTYPYGLAQAPLAERHYAEYLNPPAHTNADYDTVVQATLPPQTYSELRPYIPSERPEWISYPDGARWIGLPWHELLRGDMLAAWMH